MKKQVIRVDTTQVSTNQIVVRWSHLTRTGGVPIARYEIRRRDSSGEWLLIATVPGNITTFTDSGLDKNTSYEYEIKSFSSRIA